MNVLSVELFNFRNYSQAKVDFCKGFNLLSGANGQGKTNLAESLIFASLGVSPRTHQAQELVKSGENQATVKITLQKNYGNVVIEYIIDDQKQFFVNGNPIKKLSDLFGTIVSVYFSPSELEIVSGGPQERRDFMDNDISQLSGNYYNLVQRYNKVLFMRNKLLKSNNHKEILDQIDIWDEQLASVAAPIIRTRKNFIAKLTKPAKEAIKYLSKTTEDISLEYVGTAGESISEIKQNLLYGLKENLSKDMELGYTTLGPHRDDIKIELNGKDCKIFASQGQRRTIVLALKIAELSLFTNEMNEKPILVLDDVFSELDSTRQKKLYEVLDGYQVIMTGTTFKYKPSAEKEYKVIKVKNGKI